MARTEDSESSFLDICLPVPLIEANMILVDTPGIADSSQDDAAKLMMDYFPNALAVVFVVNVANAGGIQGDRLCRIIEHVKDSKDEMICFDPEDTLFLLNKWDAIPDEEQREEHFKEAKRRIHDIWEEITDKHILKISAAKYREPEYKGLFDDFKKNLEEIIIKNENKRLKKHRKYLKDFLKECTQKIDKRINNANKERKQSAKDIVHLEKRISNMNQINEQIDAVLTEIFENFLKMASNGCYKHLKKSDFKNKVLRDTKESNRFTVGENMLDMICEATLQWQKKHFTKLIRKAVKEKLLDISSQDVNMMQMNLQKLDVNFGLRGVIPRTLLRSLQYVAAGVVSGVFLATLFVNPLVPLGFITLGFISGVGTVGNTFIWQDFEAIRNEEYGKILEMIGNYEITSKFRKWYEEPFKNCIKGFFQKEFHDLEKRLYTMKQNNLELDKRVKALNEVKAQIFKNSQDLSTKTILYEK
uniref:Uncharacterized protein LOC111115502 n=1 Tax=Crassostrea virginica TaxID=6565 RepID=A0A8B8C2R5_CRAVI|nr:uncharacterized protein LOC111115502 [Crassostrea virginica]